MDSDHLVVAVILVPLVLSVKYSKQLRYLGSEEFLRAALAYGLFGVLIAVGAALLLAGMVRLGRNALAVRHSVREQAAGLASARAELGKASAENRRLQEELGDARGEIGNLNSELDGLRRHEAEREVKQEAFHLTVTGERPLYRLAGLTGDDVEYLIGQGYAKHMFMGIDSRGPEWWLLKGSSRESPEHFFMVHVIADYLSTKTDTVELFETREADIVFTTPSGKRFALEIESGTQLRTAKERFLEKVASLKQEYGPNWAFVVTQSNLRNCYKAYGKTFTRQTVRSYLGGFFC